jgi:flavin reductase (DIM6/NTAB) family NADH-FMN oxidoreductase RutF
MDPEVKTRVLRKLTYGMWVLSAAADGEMEASTVTWLSQASFVPPLLMVAIRHETHLRKMVEKSGAFALHLLTASQKELAGAFTLPTVLTPGKIGGVGYQTSKITGSPILEGFSTWLEAKITDTVKRGDHTVFVAEVVAAEQTDPDAKPIVLADTPWHYGG